MSEQDLPPQLQRKPGGNVESSERAPGESDPQAFARLFEQAYEKCFATTFIAPLTETESHRFSVEIGESTGLEIGWKSLKNYSAYLLGKSGRVENPSIATLDTLARYVEGAPVTTEAQRRSRERHYPYWFRYRDALRRQTSGEAHLDSGGKSEERPARSHTRRKMPGIAVAALASLIALVLIAVRLRSIGIKSMTDEFDDVSAKGLAERGWSVQSMDTAHWARRGVSPGHLTLFTLGGDNWPQPGRVPDIKNLLARSSPSDCFVADLRLTSFLPTQNWQQAGILLLEDTTFTGKSVRMSIGFNDFSGGFPKTREIIIQGITSLGQKFANPEEFVHRRLFVEEPGTALLIRENLADVGLRIEKHGAHLRLLLSSGAVKNAPYKEVGGTDFEFRPSYVAIFALKGFVSDAADMPVAVDAFRMSKSSCSP